MMSILIAYLPGDLVFVTVQGPITSSDEFTDPEKPRAWSSQVAHKDLVTGLIMACTYALQNKPSEDE